MRGYSVNWAYVRSQLERHRGGASYRTLAKELPQMSFQTCYRFLAKDTVLDLTSLLAVMTLLKLDPAACICYELGEKR